MVSGCMSITRKLARCSRLTGDMLCHLHQQLIIICSLQELSGRVTYSCAPLCDYDNDTGSGRNVHCTGCNAGHS